MSMVLLQILTDNATLYECLIFKTSGRKQK